MTNWNEKWNETHLKRMSVSKEILVLKRIVSQKESEFKEISTKLDQIYKQMHKPNFEKITKREIIKCFSSTIKPAEVEIQIKKCGMWHTIQRVSQLEKDVKLTLRLHLLFGEPLVELGELTIMINKDKSFKTITH